MVPESAWDTTRAPVHAKSGRLPRGELGDTFDMQRIVDDAVHLEPPDPPSSTESASCPSEHGAVMQKELEARAQAKKQGRRKKAQGLTPASALPADSAAKVREAADRALGSRPRS